MADLRQLVRAERRRKRRFATPGLAALHGKRRLQIVDLSLNGIGFALRHPLRPNERLQLLICAETAHFTVTGGVTWCRFEGTFHNAKGEVEPHYRAGLRFDPLHPRDAQPLLDLLDHLTTKGHGRRETPPGRRPSPASPAVPAGAD